MGCGRIDCRALQASLTAPPIFSFSRQAKLVGRAEPSRMS